MNPVSKEYLPQVEKLWQISPPYVFFQKTANYVFSAGDVIVRITPESRRSFESVNGEMQFIEHLLKHNLPIAKPVPSVNHNLCEWITSRSAPVTATVFEKIEGHHPTYEDFSAELLITLGQTLAQFHKAAQDCPEMKRHDWKGQIWPTIDKYKTLHLDPHPAEILENLAEKFSKLPKTLETYGIIHADLHPENVLIKNDGSLWFIDFDTCCYHWFVYDIATTLIHSYVYFKLLGLGAQFEKFKELILKGYETHVDPTLLDDCIALRACVFYCWASVQLEGNHCDEKGAKTLYDWKEAMKKDFLIK